MIGLFTANSIIHGAERVYQAFAHGAYRFCTNEVAFVNSMATRKINSFAPDGMRVLDFPLSKMVDELCDWNEYVNACKRFLVDNEIDTMFIVMVYMLQGKKYGQEKAIAADIASALKNHQYGMNYNISKNFLSRMLFVKACADVCDNVYHQVVDPQEPDLSRVFDFKHYDELVDLQFPKRRRIMMPYYEAYSYGVDQYAVETRNRSIDFMFGASVMSEDRMFLLDLADSLTSHMDRCGMRYDVNLHVGSKMRRETGTDKNRPFVDQREYVDRLDGVVSTLVVPAYDSTAFSWFRLVESASKGCIPLVYYKCAMDSVRRAFPGVYNVIQNDLLVHDGDDLFERVSRFSDDSERIKVCESIKDAIADRNVLDVEWLQNRWQKLEGAK